MPNKNTQCIIKTAMDTGIKTLSTLYYTISDERAINLIQYVETHGKLPSDKSTSISLERAKNIAHIYSTFRFKKATETMNDFILVEVYKIYNMLMQPIIDTADELKSIKQLTLSAIPRTICGEEIFLFDNRYRIGFRGLETRLQFPIEVMFIRRKLHINQADYPHLRKDSATIVMYNDCKEKIKDLMQARYELKTKIKDHTNTVERELQNNQTINKTLNLMSSGTEYNAMRLAMDIHIATEYASADDRQLLSPFFNYEKMKKIIETNNFAVSLNIEHTS